MFSIDVAKGTITFNAAVEADDGIEAAFEHTTKTVVSDFATGITVAGEAQEMMLEFSPIASTFKLFANGYDVPREGICSIRPTRRCDAPRIRPGRCTPHGLL